MTGSLPPLLSRLLAVALLMFVVWVLVASLIAPVVTAHRDNRRDILQAAELLDRYRRIVAAGAPVAMDSTPGTAANGFLQSESGTLAAADLQNRLKILAERAGATLKSTQTITAAAEGSAERIAVRTQLSVDDAGLRALLHGIEAGSPYLFVNTLEIQGRPLRRPGGPDAGTVLDVQMEVYGYLARRP